MRKELIEIIKNKKNKLLVTDTEKKFCYKDILPVANSLNKYHNKKIGLYFDKSSEYIVSLLSVFVSNNIFIPLNKKEPLKRLNYFYEDSKIDIILTTKNNINEKYLKNKKVIYFEDLIKNKENNIILKEKKEIYRIYTSGSTGKPKGVIINNETGLNNIINQQIKILNLKEENIFLYLSISFDASLSDIFCSVLSGSHLFINDSIILKIKTLINYFNEHKITYSDIPPSTLKLINPEKLKTLKKIIIGGEKPTKSTVMKFIDENIKVLNVYGPTESSICTSMIFCDKKWNPKNIGLPIKNINYKIINNELLISGIGLSKGYTNKNLTNERFIYIDNVRYFKTGDIVKKINNEYLFIGRVDRQIKHNGQLICLEEIEESIKAIESVSNSCVIYKDKKIINIYEGSLLNKNINNYLNNILPKYMIPKYNINMTIPKTVTGKNDVKKIEKEINL